MPGHIQVRVKPEEYEEIADRLGRKRGALQQGLKKIIDDWMSAQVAANKGENAHDEKLLQIKLTNEFENVIMPVTSAELTHIRILLSVLRCNNAGVVKHMEKALSVLGGKASEPQRGSGFNSGGKARRRAGAGPRKAQRIVGID